MPEFKQLWLFADLEEQLKGNVNVAGIPLEKIRQLDRPCAWQCGKFSYGLNAGFVC